MRHMIKKYFKFNIKSIRLSWYIKSFISKKRLKNELKKISNAYQNNLSKEYSETVVIFTSVPLFTDHVISEYALANEFKNLGMRVVMVFCDKNLPVCHAHDRYSCGVPPKNSDSINTSKVCNACQKNLSTIKDNSKIEVKKYSSYNQHSNKIDMKNIDLKEDAYASTVRYLATSKIAYSESDPLSINYLKSAKISADVVQAVIDKENPKVVIAHHGIYIPQGIVNKVCELNNINFYSWHFGYRKSTLIFSQGNTYHKEMGLQRDFENFKNNEKEIITNYLKSRWYGENDWIHFNRSPKKYDGNNNGKLRIVFYSSVDWDAALHFDKNVYSNQFDFVSELINASNNFTNIDFIIRVHPAESTGHHPSYSKLDNHIKSLEFGSNVKVIPSSDSTSSYELAESCDVAIVYNTKLGVELTSMGIPTIVAGESWVRGRGFTWDIDKKEDLSSYLERIDSLKMTESMKNLALRFAYYFYFQRCLDVPELESISKKFHISYNKDINFNKRGFKLIAEKILQGKTVSIES